MAAGDGVRGEPGARADARVGVRGGAVRTGLAAARSVVVEGVGAARAVLRDVLVRWLFDRVRPIEYHLPSYPSGHTVAVASVGFTMVVLLRHRMSWGSVLWAVLAVLVGGFARVVLEMHWVTDVIGAALGVTGVGLVAALALGLVTSGRELVPHLVRPRRRP
ncbi:phosphatase PAP2 family protein [Lentzea indica]|uniref:phosphatase PAP2 family protein n=1 Tax=Lentzea indica TaxID=2604800 RepID=UPI00143ACC41|nr:phosphatase PAP2 family protein [Lentzea indica]